MADTTAITQPSPAAKALEVARKRLAAAAKALESAKGTEDSSTKIAEEATKMAEMAKKNREVAQSQYDDNKKEFEEAESLLKEAEERREVVAVKSENDDRLFDADTDDESNENESRKKQKTGVVESILVRGCGVPGANGTYKRDDELCYGVHQYYKKGKWKGKDETYTIWYTSHWKKWYISAVGSLRWYSAPATTGEFAEVPPENGWKVCNNGIKGRDPAPTLKLL